MPVENFIAFIENTYNNSEALKFTDDIEGLLTNMQDIYPHLKDRSIKNRFSRLRKKIKGSIALEETDTESISSATTQSSVLQSDNEDLDLAQLSQKSS